MRRLIFTLLGLALIAVFALVNTRPTVSMVVPARR